MEVGRSGEIYFLLWKEGGDLEAVVVAWGSLVTDSNSSKKLCTFEQSAKFYLLEDRMKGLLCL